MIKVGPSGNCEEFYAEGHKGTEEAAAFVKLRGLDLYEYSFGQGVRIGEEKASSIGKSFLQNGVEISAHAPYFINLANPDEEMAERSFEYILSTARALQKMGGNRIVFHPATEGKDPRSVAFQRTLDRVKTLRDRIFESGLETFLFCPETMGKLAQIGTIEEVVKICKCDEIFIPCIDFGHVNAREGGSLKRMEDYKIRLEYAMGELGEERMKHFHIHFSKIQYGARGEIKHLTFDDTLFGPEFEPLCEALLLLELEPHIICESSGTQTRDAMYMKNVVCNAQKNI